MEKIDEQTGLPILTNGELMLRADFVYGLRELANFYEAHPNLPAPQMGKLNIPTLTAEELAACRRAAGFKQITRGEHYVSFDQDFGGITISIFVMREEVCRLVQVGEQTLPAEPEKTIPAQPERTVPKMEWRCDPILEQTDEEASGKNTT